MAKKNKFQTDSNASNKSSYDNYYELKKDAVDRLVNTENYVDNMAPSVSEVGRDQDNIAPYKTGVLDKIPGWVKALIVKFWFAGAICYFILWGIGSLIGYNLDMWLVLSVVMGLVTDLLVNNIFRFIQSDNREMERWMTISVKKWWTIFVNIAFSAIVVAMLVVTYTLINKLIISVGGLPQDSVPLGVEPMLFGLIYLGYDILLITIKNLIIKIARLIKQSTAKQQN